MDLLTHEYKYVLQGEPETYAKSHYNKGAAWGSCREVQLINRITLESQRSEIAIINAQIYLKIDFYFLNRSKSHHNKTKDMYYYCIDVPNIVDLARWYVDLCTGIIWSESKKIAKIEAEKHVDMNPRTEITVRIL